MPYGLMEGVGRGGFILVGSGFGGGFQDGLCWWVSF